MEKKSSITDDYKSNNSIEEADFETAISATGFGKFNIVLLLITIPSGWGLMYSTTVMSYVFPVARCDLQLSPNNMGLINASTYLGMIIGALLWGYLADTLGRKRFLVIGFILDAIFEILCGFSQNLTMVIVTKFLTGLIINGPFALVTTILSEFHCTKYRARVLMVMGILYNLGLVSLPILGWISLSRKIDIIIFGRLELHSWNFFIMGCGLPSLISGFAHIILPESPKFLMMVGRNKEALEVFKHMYSSNTGKPPESYPIKSLLDEIKLRESNSANRCYITGNRTKIQALREGWQQIKPLFYPPWLSKIVLVIVIQFGFMMGLNTFRLWLPQIFTAINDYEYYNQKEAFNESVSLCTMLETFQTDTTSNTTDKICVVNFINDSVYINSIIVCSAAIIGFLLAGILINKLGKKPLLCLTGTISGSCCVCIYFSKSSAVTTILSSLSMASAGVFGEIMLTVVVDLFPTSLRTVAVASTMMLARSGSMIGNVAFPILLGMGCLPPFLVIGCTLLGCTLLSLILPKTDLKSLE